MRQKYLYTLALAAALLPAAAQAQHIAVGGVIGAGVTDAFHDQNITSLNAATHYFSDSKDFIAGPQVELRFPADFSVELDLLYRRLHVTGVTTPTNSTPATVDRSFGSWEFPLLLKYRFATVLPWAKPLVEVGPSFRAGSGAGAEPSGKGLTIGGGLEASILKLKVAPQLRFTHWGGDKPANALAGAPQTNQNQIEFLVGFSF